MFLPLDPVLIAALVAACVLAAFLSTRVRAAAAPQSCSVCALADPPHGLLVAGALDRRAAAVAGLVPVVAIIGVDRFDGLRLRVGSAFAGETMRLLAARMATALPAAEIGRIGRTTIDFGFAVAPDAVEPTLEALQEVLAAPLDVDGHLLELTIRIGFVEVEKGGSADDVAAIERAIERAEHALSDARTGRRKRARFDPAGELDTVDRLLMMRDLRLALGRGEMFLCYQPKYRSRTGGIDACEALLRWRHPTRGLIAPAIFIPIAEEIGEIRALTVFVIEQAIRDQRLFLTDGYKLSIDVNISGRLLGNRAFAEWALATLAGAVGPIGFEITETAVIDDPDGALRNLHAFVAAGVRIAIDDYGSGLSSLAYLKQLPAHELKIDRMFVSTLTSSHRDPLLVRSTIDLAHALEMEVTAEGVETPAAMALLRVMGCDMIQGYLISPPLERTAFVRFLDSRARDISPDASIAQDIFSKWRKGGTGNGA